MGDQYMRECERIEEVRVMQDVSNGGARTVDMEATNSGPSIKRRKVDSPETLHSRSSNSHLEIECRRVFNYSPEVSISPAVSGTFDHVIMSSLCSSNDSSEVVKDSFGTSDLKAAESFETELMSKFSSGGFSRETTPSSEVSIDSERMESSTPKKKPASASSHCKPTVSKIPSAMEIEEFFSVAEKYEQKRFADKYNYDVVKDVPLEGRYQWVKLKP